MKNRITTVGVIHIAYGLFLLMVTLIILAVMIAGGFAAQASGVEDEALPILLGVGLPIACFMGALSIAGVVGGWGLLKLRPWARVLVMVRSGVALLDIPIGTAVGVYSFMVLTKDEDTAALSGNGG